MTHPQTFAVQADMRFSTEVPGQGTLRGTIAARGRLAEVRLQGPLRSDLGRDAKALRGLAAALAGADTTLVVYLDDVALLELGRVDAPWWQHLVARSRHVRVTSARGVAAVAAPRRRGVSLHDLIPPLTLLPIAPTFVPTQRPATTTHDPRRGGNPRLVLVSGDSVTEDEREVVFPLRRDVTRIGSGEQCDVRIAGLEEVHAELVHDARDEFVVRDRSRLGTTLINGVRAADAPVLRTGARITLGDTVILVYRRAEYADHGRPFGGRVGGEIGHQRSQPDPRRATSAGGRSRLSFPLRLRGAR